jgi:hypothetical protein
MTAVFIIRGDVGQAQTENCTGIEEALQRGQRLFRAFDKRNPWIFADSVSRRVYILLDPDTEVNVIYEEIGRTHRTVLPRRNRS